MRFAALASATLLGVACLAAEEPVAPAAAAPALEPMVVDNKPITVTPKKEIPINITSPVEVSTRELWYRSFDGKAWGAWQKHGIAFARETPIVWAAPEGHWQIFVRQILTSGLATPVPQADIKPAAEFIIDRTVPTVAIAFPAVKEKLRGGDKYTLKWEAKDPYLKNTPITVLYSRDGQKFDVQAENLPNSGSFEWTVPKDMTITGILRIQAADKAANVGSADISSLLIDSIRPKGKVLGPAITKTLETALDLEIADQGPAGLATARLWVSRDDGTSWTEGPWIQDPKKVAWKAPEDGRYRLAIVAKDAAGNESPTPKGKADDQTTIVVDTTAPSIALASAIGISEAEKPGPAGRRDFKPGDRVQVQFTAKDANAAPGTVSVFLQTDPAKPWSELGKNLPADAAFRFDIPAIETKTARVKVTAVDAAGNLGEAVSSELFTIQTQVADAAVEVQLTP